MPPIHRKGEAMTKEEVLSIINEIEVHVRLDCEDGAITVSVSLWHDGNLIDKDADTDTVHVGDIMP